MGGGWQDLIKGQGPLKSTQKMPQLERRPQSCTIRKSQGLCGSLAPELLQTAEGTHQTQHCSSRHPHLTPHNPVLTQGVLGGPEVWEEVSLKLNYGSFSTTREALTLSFVSTSPLKPRHKGREKKNHHWLRAIKKGVGNQHFYKHPPGVQHWAPNKPEEKAP